MMFFSKTHQSSLTLNEGFFSKITPSLFTIKEGSTSHLGLLPSGEKRKPLLLVARNHFILWLADHQRSRQQRSCDFLCGDEPAFTQGLGYGLPGRCLGLLDDAVTTQNLLKFSPFAKVE